MKEVVLKKLNPYMQNTIMCMCGSPNIHQKEVSVFWRDEEDSQVGKNFRSSQQATESFLTQNENPSPRRDGLLIKFSCEQCDAEPEMAIYQHKGSTFINWHSARQKLTSEK